MSHHRSKSLDILIENDNIGSGTSSTNELEQFLIEREQENNNNSIVGYFSKLGNNVKKFVPKRMGGTGNIEDDIALRFGIFGSNASSSASTNDDRSCIRRFLTCSCSLSRKERIIGFFVLFGLGITFFVLSSFYIPLLLLKARKFSILFTFGSLFTFASLSLLWGIGPFFKHIISKERIPFTGMYIGSLVVTLVFAIELQNTILTVIGIVIQILSLLSFVISYLPGGIAGLTYLTKFISSSFTRTLPI